MVSLPRRYFLKSTGLAMAGFAAAPEFLVRTALAQDAAQPAQDRPILIVVFQRGAVDGISMVAPYGDRQYAAGRPQIAIAPPQRGNAETAIDLDGFYGLHPALEALKPIYDEGRLAAVHAVGSPNSSRSHFEAQDYMEAGAPENKSAYDGWLNRFLQAETSAPPSLFRGIALTPSMPRTLMGAAPALAFRQIQEFDVRIRNNREARALGSIAAEFEAMWGNANTATFEAIRMLRAARPEDIPPANGAQYPASPYGQALLQLAQIVKADVGLEVGFADIGGWDTHASQGGAQGQLSARLRELGGGLAAFYRDLGDRMRNVVVLTMTEFGRTVRQNGSGGTDHGYGSALFAMGGPVKGGKVYGKWPGLAPEQLFQGRDLAITTDFRTVFAEILAGHMRAGNVSHIFPGWQPGQPLGLI